MQVAERILLDNTVDCGFEDGITDHLTAERDICWFHVEPDGLSGLESAFNTKNYTHS